MVVLDFGESQLSPEFEEQETRYYVDEKWPPHLRGQCLPSTSLEKKGKFLFREGCAFVKKCHQQLEPASCVIASLWNLLSITDTLSEETVSELILREKKIGSRCVKMKREIPKVLNELNLEIEFTFTELSDFQEMEVGRKYMISLTDDSVNGVGSHAVVAIRPNRDSVRVWDSQTGWVCDVKDTNLFNAWLTAGSPIGKGHDRAEAFIF